MFFSPCVFAVFSVRPRCCDVLLVQISRGVRHSPARANLWRMELLLFLCQPSEARGEEDGTGTNSSKLSLDPGSFAEIKCVCDTGAAGEHLVLTFTSF